MITSESELVSTAFYIIGRDAPTFITLVCVKLAFRPFDPAMFTCELKPSRPFLIRTRDAQFRLEPMTITSDSNQEWSLSNFSIIWRSLSTESNDAHFRTTTLIFQFLLQLATLVKHFPTHHALSIVNTRSEVHTHHPKHLNARTKSMIVDKIYRILLEIAPIAMIISHSNRCLPYNDLMAPFIELIYEMVKTLPFAISRNNALLY